VPKEHESGNAEEEERRTVHENEEACIDDAWLRIPV
jgi:hypothetical protein